MIETYAILATIVGLTGWVLFADYYSSGKAMWGNRDFWFNKSGKIAEQVAKLESDNATLRAKLSRNTPRDANGRFVKGGE